MTPSERISACVAELGDWRGKTMARLRKLIGEAAPDLTDRHRRGRPDQRVGVQGARACRRCIEQGAGDGEKDAHGHEETEIDRTSGSSGPVSFYFALAVALGFVWLSLTLMEVRRGIRT